jgi:hypothetical protein
MTAPATPPKKFKAECPKCNKLAEHEEFFRCKNAKWGRSGALCGSRLRPPTCIWGVFAAGDDAVIGSAA